MGTPQAHNMATHSSSNFKPLSSIDHETINQTSRGLSLWMNQLSHHQAHETKVFGTKPSSNITLKLITSATNSLPLGNIIKDATCTSQLISVPSLYSSQHQSHQTSLATNMSATALLQKAAQIGATSTTDPSFIGSLGLKCSNNQGQDGNKIFLMYGSSLAPTSFGNEAEN
ncbi:unnamed protein product [Lupinus luteus]|uniref:Uncharacterized protein n=1 Tax=Lupinus luteus TaxID=3873 RepID=A0AAV1XGV9_LUPLU